MVFVFLVLVPNFAPALRHAVSSQLWHQRPNRGKLMNRFTLLVSICVLLLAGSAGATEQLQKLSLDPSAEIDHKVLSVVQDDGQRLTLEFSLPFLNLENIDVEGEAFQAFTIPGGDVRGELGQAALPTLSRLIAVPDNAAVSIEVHGTQKQVFSDLRVFPMQPDEGEHFVIDTAYYTGASADAAPLVKAGAPAIMHGLRVVPLTISPVSYDPASKELTVTDRFEIEIDLSGRDTRNGVAPTHSRIAESFHHMYQDLVVNYRDDGAEVGLGSYLIICPNNSTVISYLQPLVDWRSRQGYNVVLAHTGQTGTSTNNIKNYIQNAYNSYDPPLEFVTLVGDANGSYSIPCWYESESGYGGEGDHYYTTVAGGDMLGDVHLGRLSIRSTGELSGIVNKIINYETTPPTSDAGWFTRAGLVGDPGSSGITCIFVNQWVKSHLLNVGYTQVDTAWSGNFVNQMNNMVNQGSTVFGYRGYYWMSGYDSGHIDYLDNGYELPFAVIPTCDTGSFADDSHCRSEAYLRNPDGGGIGGIGTATTGTHTRYNNCYYMGTWDGAVNGSDHRLGVAHSTGKLYLYTNYIDYEASKVEIWSMWNNLMGDPATPMWTAYPTVMSVDHPTVVPNGVGSVNVDVSAGGPVEDALVTLYRDGQLQVSGYTDYSGSVTLPISGVSSGQVLVTVTKYNHRPYLGSFNVGSIANYPAVSDFDIDDDNSGTSSGNNNGQVNPAESIELPTALRNYGNSSASNVTATLNSTDPYVTVTDGNENFGTIASGATVWSGDDFDVTIANNAPAGHVIDLDVTATSGGNDWISLIQLTVESAAFEYIGYNWGGSGHDPAPGLTGTIAFTVNNTGSITASGITAALTTDSPWINVTDPNGSYSNINPGANGTNTSDTFEISVSSDCFQGHLAGFTVTYQFNGAAVATCDFAVAVGQVSSDDPVGPDAYGYYAFDNSDTDYIYAPTYSWVEIDPNYGGSGSSVGLSDFGWEQDDIEVETLPFDFQYYGETFSQISICSNGFVSLGVSSLKPYRNFVIPGVNANPNQIAVYWDNLYQTGSNLVYHWYDDENGRYVIQWSRMRADYNNATQNVQLILLDPAMYPTTTGDGRILMQYQTVNNQDSRDGYCTVGIGNSDRSDGICYTYARDYAPGAPDLSGGTAILFMPVGDIEAGILAGTVTNASNGGTPAEGVLIRVLESGQQLYSTGNGTYSGSVTPGTYTVRAEHESFAQVTVNDVEIVDDETTTVDFDLNDILGPYITNTTNLPFTDDNSGPYVVDTYITDYSDIAEMHFYYQTTGSPVEAALVLIDAQTGHYQAEIPGFPYNTEVEYWIEAVDTGDNASRDPEGTDNYSFWILQMATAFFDDMETDQGWSVGDTGDDASTGVWERGEPDGTYDGSTQIQPEYDHTPNPAEQCWVTGNAATDDQGADDIDGGKTTLKSPVFDLSESVNVTVSYYRWYTNDSGASPGQDYWVVEVNDGSGWVALENTNVTNRSWLLREFLLDDHIDLTTTVQFRFVGSDEGDGSLVEAALDDFRIEGFTIPDATPVLLEPLPERLALRPNHPNPFNPMTLISFELPETQSVSVRVFDVTGRLVRTVVEDATLPAGVHGYNWNGNDDDNNPVGSGVYFYVLETSIGRLSGKMTLLK